MLGQQIFCKLKEDNHSQIPTLRTESLEINTTDIDKAACLNNVFRSNFNTASSGITETNIGDVAVTVDPNRTLKRIFYTENDACFTLFVDVRYQKGLWTRWYLC